MAEANTNTFTLNSGHQTPKIALGTWQSDGESVKTAVKVALKAGYKSIDTAEVYENEEQIGAALKESFEEGVVERKDLYITSKLYNNCHAADKVKSACQDSLKRLGLDYLDLYLIHWPISGEDDFGFVTLDYVPLSQTWAMMEQLVEEGLVKSIGVSNFNVQLVLDLLSYAKIKPAVIQVEMHPYHPQTEYVNWAQGQGIQMEAYSPLSTVSIPGIPKPEHTPLFETEVVKELAEKHGKTAAQIVLAWNLARGVRVLVKSVTESRIQENLGALEVTLSAEDTQKIDALDFRMRIYDFWKYSGLPIFN